MEKELINKLIIKTMQVFYSGKLQKSKNISLTLKSIGNRIDDVTGNLTVKSTFAIIGNARDESMDV